MLKARECVQMCGFLLKSKEMFYIIITKVTMAAQTQALRSIETGVSSIPQAYKINCDLFGERGVSRILSVYI